MRNSSEKRLDMARSILPSRSRAAAGELVAVRRRARRTYNRHLAQARHDPEGLPLHVDPRAYPAAEIRMVVRWRRAADKLNHFERWAVRVTVDVRPEDRLGMLRALLPDGVVGDHALSHLRRIPELNLDAPAHRWARPAREPVADLRGPVLLALADGRHGDLNRAMKRAAVGDPPAWRVLAGTHDVDAFLAEVALVGAWSRALDTFLARTSGRTAPAIAGRLPFPRRNIIHAS